ncbi:MAG: hypothetical protein ORN51_07100 [Akkermansiaceae bacterium]|nr:hypothetical protein [Akkermansiaceae bacterium]
MLIGVGSYLGAIGGVFILYSLVVAGDGSGCIQRRGNGQYAEYQPDEFYD